MIIKNHKKRLATIALSNYVLVQGDLVVEYMDGTGQIKVDNKIYMGKLL